MINPASSNLWKQFESLVPAQDLNPPVAQTPVASDSYQPAPPALPVYQPQYFAPASASNDAAPAPAPTDAPPANQQDLQKAIMADQQSSFQLRQDAISKEDDAYAQINGGCDPAPSSSGILPFGWG